jgi:hypothetical protein
MEGRGSSLKKDAGNVPRRKRPEKGAGQKNEYHGIWVQRAKGRHHHAPTRTLEPRCKLKSIEDCTSMTPGSSGMSLRLKIWNVWLLTLLSFCDLEPRCKLKSIEDCTSMTPGSSGMSLRLKIWNVWLLTLLSFCDILFPLAMARTTAALFLGRDAARASALKPPFSEIYQTTTPPTTAADGVLDTGMDLCGAGEWTLDGTSCYLSTTGAKNYADAVAECESVGGWPFTPANADDVATLLSITTSMFVWAGIKSTDGDPSSWKDYFGNDPSYYNWLATPISISSGRCIFISRSDGKYYSTSCSFDITITMVCTKASETTEQPPASVNGGGGGSLGVPFSGEIALYRQFLDPSTGVESAYLYPELKFVEADEAIHRAGLVSVSSFLPLFLFLPLPSLPHQFTLYSLVSDHCPGKLSFESLCLHLLLLFSRQSVLLPRRVQRLVCSTNLDPI